MNGCVKFYMVELLVLLLLHIKHIHNRKGGKYQEAVPKGIWSWFIVKTFPKTCLQENDYRSLWKQSKKGKGAGRQRHNCYNVSEATLHMRENKTRINSMMWGWGHRFRLSAQQRRVWNSILFVKLCQLSRVANWTRSNGLRAVLYGNPDTSFAFKNASRSGGKSASTIMKPERFWKVCARFKLAQYYSNSVAWPLQVNFPSVGKAANSSDG